MPCLNVRRACALRTCRSLTDSAAAGRPQNRPLGSAARSGAKPGSRVLGSASWGLGAVPAFLGGGGVGSSQGRLAAFRPLRVWGTVALVAIGAVLGYAVL